MRLCLFRRHRYVVAALLMVLPQLAAAQSPANAPRPPAAVAPAMPTPSPEAMAEYRRKLAVYTLAREAFQAEAGAYWNAVADQRRVRNAKRRDRQEIEVDDYVLTQPPVYAGPPRPVDPSAVKEEPPPRKYVPVVADFVQAAAQHFRFVPQRPQNELDYKRAYAKVAAAAGLTREQIVRIYGFESGGNGPYDVQAGLERPSPNARAITTALGYNQLLGTNTVEILAESGERFVKVLRARAAAMSGEPRRALDAKIAVLQRMVEYCRTVPDSWSEHERLANTAKGLGVHAMVLDIDVGPLLQTQKLLDSVVFARRKGYLAPLTAAELEMMNLTGDGNGIDMVMMPAQMRPLVPTANFFQRGGYERNPVAIRNNVVAKLLAATDAKMDKEVQLQGARDLASAYPR
jgi:hypothetical protein